MNMKVAPVDESTGQFESLKRRILAVSGDGTLKAPIRNIVGENCKKAERRKAF